MKFLCLPGGFGNAKTFRMQLGPFCSDLEKEGVASFVFTQGAYPCEPPPAYEGYFGAGPHYRFTEPDHGVQHEVHEAIREFPEAESPEEAIRTVVNGFGEKTLSYSRIEETIDMIHATMDMEGDIEGIIGFSEGSMIAASVVLEEQRRFLEYGIEPRLKCAIFIAGWPPIGVSNGQMVLADETEELINIPTCHVMGAGDPMIPGSMALFNLCNMDNAELFDHGQGHVIPRDQDLVKELNYVVKTMIRDVERTGDSP